MYSSCVVGLHLYHLRWRFFADLLRSVGFGLSNPWAGDNRTMYRVPQRRSIMVWNLWAGTGQLPQLVLEQAVCLRQSPVTDDMWWAVGVDVSPLFFFLLSEGREGKRLVPGEALGIMRGRKGSEGGVWLPHWTHSHSWSEREERTYWFPGLSLHNYLLSTSFWERSMCLVRSWKLCLEVSRVLTKRQLIPQFYLELQESFVEFF